MGEQRWTIGVGVGVGVRIDREVARHLGVATREARRLCAAGVVRCNGRRAAAGDRGHPGDQLEVEIPPSASSDGPSRWLGPPPSSQAPTLWQGNGVLVVNKPAGVPCHPLRPGEGGTVVDDVARRYPEVLAASVEEREGGLLHRLDTGTSGCLAFARDRDTWERLRATFHDADKVYLARCRGRLGPVGYRVVVDVPLTHDGDRRRMRVTHSDDPRGQPARTEVVVVADDPAGSTVRLTLHGGRRHQLRVHLQHLGAPLLGDPLYDIHTPSGPFARSNAEDAAAPAGFVLHAWRLTLPGMSTVEAPIPSTLTVSGQDV